MGAAGASYGARAFTATTGTWRVQARYASGALAHSAPVTLTWPAAATPLLYATGSPSPNPTTNAGLVQDCTALLEARDALAGPGRLNWDGTRALSAWTGVTLGGTPQRVTALRLGAQGLAGPLPAALGRLTQLTALDLRGNALTGAVPEALGTLTRLTELRLGDTRLTGCLPAALAGVTDHGRGGAGPGRLPGGAGLRGARATTGSCRPGCRWAPPSARCRPPIRTAARSPTPSPRATPPGCSSWTRPPASCRWRGTLPAGGASLDGHGHGRAGRRDARVPVAGGGGGRNPAEGAAAVPGGGLDLPRGRGRGSGHAGGDGHGPRPGRRPADLRAHRRQHRRRLRPGHQPPAR